MKFDVTVEECDHSMKTYIQQYDDFWCPICCQILTREKLEDEKYSKIFKVKREKE